jgi:hypothetical protein
MLFYIESGDKNIFDSWGLKNRRMRDGNQSDYPLELKLIFN